MTQTDALQILLVGDVVGVEVRPIAEFLRDATDLFEVSGIQQAIATVESGELVPDAVVLVQDRPGVFAHEQLEQLRRVAPLARYLALLGTWCEGEQRTGQPWPGMIRTYWHQWLARWAAELRRGEDLGQSVSGELRWWGLPDTAGDEERLIQAAETPWPQRDGLVAVFSSSMDRGDYLVEACVAAGYSAIWMNPQQPVRIGGPQVVLWDGSADELSSLEGVREEFPAAPIVTLLDFPRIDDVERAMSLGASAVLAKPVRLEDLFFELERVADCAAAQVAASR